MSEVRFRINGVEAGSSARSAEAQNRQDRGAGAGPRSWRIQAGSAARLAEEARRAEGQQSREMPTLALRAQGGRVLAQEKSSSHHSGAREAQVEPRSAPTAAAPEPGAMPSREAAAAAGSPDLPRTGALQHAGSRLHSMIRALFASPERARDPKLDSSL